MIRSPILAFKVAATVIVAVASASCDRGRDVINDSDPFLQVVVSTPADGGPGIEQRAKRFASAQSMRMEYSSEHFAPGEYSVRLVRPDLNIAAENVTRGRQSVVRAYARGQPTPAGRNEAKQFLCKVMLHGC